MSKKELSPEEQLERSLRMAAYARRFKAQSHKVRKNLHVQMHYPAVQGPPQNGAKLTKDVSTHKEPQDDTYEAMLKQMTGEVLGVDSPTN